MNTIFVRHSLVFLFLCAVALIQLQRVSAVNLNSFHYYQQQIEQLFWADGALREQLLRVKTGLANHYDLITKNQLLVMRICDDLKNRFRQDKELGIGSKYLSRFQQQFNKHIQLVEDFKSDNVAYKNLLRYYPVANKSVLNKVPTTGPMRQLRGLLQEQNLLVFNLAFVDDNQLAAQLNKNIKKIQQFNEGIPDKTQAEIQSLGLHAKNMITLKVQIDELLAVLTHNNEIQLIDDLDRIIKKRIKASQTEHQQEKDYLSISLLLVAVYGVYLLYRLIRIIGSIQHKNTELSSVLESEVNNSRRKDTFMTTVSNELQIMANGIGGCLELLESEYEPVRAQLYLRNAYNNSERFISLMSTVVYFSKFKSGDITLSDKTFDLRELLEKIGSYFSAKCEHRRLSYKLEWNLGDASVVKGDSFHLRLLLEQLLENAVKFTDVGGVTLCVSRAKNKEDIVFDVIDTGIGIPSNSQADLMVAFRQLHSDDNPLRGGVGIGLSMCKELVSLMGGRLEYEPTLTDGSHFTLSLKLSVSSELHCENTVLSAKHISEAVVLVVDDNSISLSVLSNILDQQGYQVLKAEDGKQAIEIINDHCVDIILMDCQMPVMDGFSATRSIRRQQGDATSLPIIAVTANTTGKDLEYCLEVGMNDYIVKPFSKEIVSEKISFWLHMRERYNTF